MTRTANVALLVLMIAGAAFTYDAKYRAEIAATRVAELRQAIDREKAQLSLLRAEWSVLSQPDRLQGLVERFHDYLGLQPFEVDQLVSIDEVPGRPVPIMPEGGGAAMGGFAGGSTNSIQ